MASSSIPSTSAKPSSAQASAELSDIGLNEVEEVWPRVIDYVKTKRMSTGIFLSEAAPVEVADGLVTIGFPNEFQFHKEMLEKPNNRQLVEEAFEVSAGKKIRVQFAVTQADRIQETVPKSSDASVQRAPDSSAGGEARQSGKLTEIVTEALNIFDGAKIVRAE